MSAITKVNREEFLRKLEEVQPGLAQKGIVEQSTCFAFSGGYIITFNEEVMCRARSGLPKEAKGAIEAKKFMELLRSLPDESIGLQFQTKQIMVTGKNKRSGIVMEKQILVPIDAVDKPQKWQTIHDDFTDAVGIVQECATNNQEAFTLTCIHIHPKWMEAFDNVQLTRYVLKTGVTKPFLVKKNSIKFVPSYAFTHVAETGNWLHFKTDAGTIMSIRRYVSEASDYQNLTDALKIKGVPTVLPKALGEAAKRANIMSAVGSDNNSNLATVEMRSGRLRITGRGDSGWYQEVKRLKYEGPDMKFLIAPNLLVEILKRQVECEISKKHHKLKIDGGKFVYVVCLKKG